jgi:hypothetical protein
LEASARKLVPSTRPTAKDRKTAVKEMRWKRKLIMGREVAG